jgi:hypothetical protein
MKPSADRSEGYQTREMVEKGAAYHVDGEASGPWPTATRFRETKTGESLANLNRVQSMTLVTWGSVTFFVKFWVRVS